MKYVPFNGLISTVKPLNMSNLETFKKYSKFNATVQILKENLDFLCLFVFRGSTAQCSLPKMCMRVFDRFQAFCTTREGNLDLRSTTGAEI